MTDQVYILIIIDTRCNVPDAYTKVYKNLQDAVQAGLRFVRENDCTMPEEDIYSELNDGDGINIRNELYVLPIETTTII